MHEQERVPVTPIEPGRKVHGHLAIAPEAGTDPLVLEGSSWGSLVNLGEVRHPVPEAATDRVRAEGIGGRNRVEGIVYPLGVVIALHLEFVLETGAIRQRKRQPPQVVAVERGEVMRTREAGDHRSQADGVGRASEQKYGLTRLDYREFMLSDVTIDRLFIDGFEFADDVRFHHVGKLRTIRMLSPGRSLLLDPGSSEARRSRGGEAASTHLPCSRPPLAGSACPGREGESR